MSEIAEFAHHGADSVTRETLDRLLHQMPMLKAEFAQIEDEKHPHLRNQLNFLAELVEDFSERAVNDIPYTVVAHAAFALIYAHRAVDLIPDSLPELGHADDSAVARAVLILYEKQLRDYADSRDLDWSTITSQA
jgi:uncharacterized membrane protein YkvA (DUF1232 family)